MAFDGTTPVYQRYKPFGETRLTNPLGTKYTFTGQLSHTDDFGLLFFNARWVDPQLARFAQADTIVPDAYNPQDYDRFSYVRNNPLRYIDPSGHICFDTGGGMICSMDDDSNGWWFFDFNAYVRSLDNSLMKYPGDLQISQEGLKFIMEQERFVEQLYNDGNTEDEYGRYDVHGNGKGHCTIGFGHLVHTGACDGRPS